jgi:hypothetical protein
MTLARNTRRLFSDYVGFPAAYIYLTPLSTNIHSDILYQGKIGRKRMELVAGKET